MYRSVRVGVRGAWVGRATSDDFMSHVAYGDGERHTHYDGGTGVMSKVQTPHERRANGAAASGELYFSSPKAKDAFKRVKAIVALEKGRQVANFLERKHE